MYSLIKSSAVIFKKLLPGNLYITKCISWKISRQLPIIEYKIAEIFGIFYMYAHRINQSFYVPIYLQNIAVSIRMSRVNSRWAI